MSDRVGLEALIRQGIGLREAGSGDRGFLRSLYGEGRRQELRPLDWPDHLTALFLDQQFALQQRHIACHHPQAERLVVERAGEAIGRLDVDRGAPCWRLIELALVERVQGLGIGGRLLGRLQSAAREAGMPIDLHVVIGNDHALRLYHQAGFVGVGHPGGTHEHMRWYPDEPGAIGNGAPAMVR